MNSIQVYSDLPAVDYQEEMWYGSWQQNTQLPSIHHYLEAMDTNLHGIKAEQVDFDLHMNMRPITYRDTPCFTQSHRHSVQPWEEREHQIQSSWNAPAIRFQYPPVSTDDLSYRSDHSSASSEEARSPSGMVGQLSSPTATELEESGPLTPPLSHPYYTQSQAYPYQQLRQSAPTFVLNGPVTLRDVQYEHDLDESNAYHMDPTAEQWSPNVLYRPYGPDNDVAETIDDVDEVDTVKHEVDLDYTPTKPRMSRKKNAKCTVTSHAKKNKLLNGKNKPVVQAVGNHSITKSRPKTSTTRRRSSRTGNQTTTRNVDSRSIEIEHQQHAEKRRFICSFARYGCMSTFANKNEWKRHVYSQHLQLGFYRCDLAPCNALSSTNTPRRTVNAPHGTQQEQFDDDPHGEGIFNDFNRKDLFTQHLRRMHSPWNPKSPQPQQFNTSATINNVPHASPSSTSTKANRLFHQPTTPMKPYTPSQAEKAEFETSLESIRTRCWHQKRYPPATSNCGFCPKVFVGEGSWENRMEHVGRHLEELGADLDPDEEEEDDDESDVDASGDDEDNNVPNHRQKSIKTERRQRGRKTRPMQREEIVVMESEDPELTAWGVKEGILVWNSASRAYVLA